MKDKILQAITIQDILQKYRVPLGRHNRIPCPIHNGKSNNFSYNDKVFQCWSCHCSGNVISLVMQLHNLDFKSALIRINYDFGLNFSQEKPSYRDILKAREIAKQREAEKQRIIDEETLFEKVTYCRRYLFMSNDSCETEATKYYDSILDEARTNKRYLYQMGMDKVMDEEHVVECYSKDFRGCMSVE